MIPMLKALGLSNAISLMQIFLGQHLLIRISKSVGLIMSLLCVRGLSAVPSNTARLKQHDFMDVSFHNWPNIRSNIQQQTHITKSEANSIS